MRKQLSRQNKIILATLLVSATLLLLSPSVAWGRVKPLGFWIYVEHTKVILARDDHDHQHYAPYAYHGYAILESSTGPVDFSYDWDYPYLDVYIWNPNYYAVEVVWRCWFYVW